MSVYSMLRDNKQGWLVTKNGTVITCGKVYSKFAVFFEIKTLNSQNKISFPSYRYISHISHYKPAVDEIRFKRQKGILFHVVRFLKRQKVWNLISNKTHSEEEELRLVVCV